MCLKLAFVALLAGSTWAAAQSPPAGGREGNVDRAQEAARQFLLTQIPKEGRCLGELEGNQHYGGRTALCVYALLTSGVDHKQPQVAAALDWLLSANLKSTYAISMRACALAAVRDQRVLKPLAADVDWLVKAAAQNGAYSYSSYGGGACGEYDNSNAHMAVLGVWAGARRGLSVPPQYWQLVERFWTEQQQPDGGWGYFTRDGARTKTYGSMSAAGLATLLVCFDNLHREQFVRCTATSEPKPIASAFKWLSQNYRPDENPKLGGNRYIYWLYALERVGLASGYKYLNGRDWFWESAGELLTRQNADGSWDYGSERLTETSMALLFLSRGREPVIMNKLHYDGKWNARPRDLANFTLYLGETFEQPYRWQVVDVQAPMGDWHDAPVLYISGAGAVEFSQEQVDKLRRFVLEGGTIVSESACNNVDFTLDMQRFYKRMFPAYELKRLADDHPIYSSQFSIKQRVGLMGMSNGVRMLAIHCPQELSMALQLGASPTNQPIFELATNIVYYLTDKGQLQTIAETWQLPQNFQPRATIKLAQVQHGGNANPEPLAWQRLGLEMARKHAIRLELSEPVDPAKLDAKAWPIALLSGTGSVTFSKEQAEGIKNYLAQGGRLIVESAGGEGVFTQSAERQILPLYPGGQSAPLASFHEMYTVPQKIAKPAFRADLAMLLGVARNDGRLRALADGQRIIAVFSNEDLSAGLLGVSGYKIRGYTPFSAVALATNILCHFAGITPAEATTEKQ